MALEARLQRRVQRYGWDRAVDAYARHWHGPLAGLHEQMLTLAELGRGESVLDLACGTGVVATAAARAVGPAGSVVGVDIADGMVAAAAELAQRMGLPQVRFARMDAEELAITDARFDAALCALGLMYMPNPTAALRELRRVLRPAGRAVLAVWGERSRCGWAPLFGIVDAEVSSEVCPLFFGLGQGDALPRCCAEAGLDVLAMLRRSATLDYADGDEACAAAFAGGPVAMAWSRFDGITRRRVHERYLEALTPWRTGRGYRIPAEFAIAVVRRQGSSATDGSP